MDEAKAERSRLINKQNAERKEVEKEVKKKKGAMKVTAQEKLEALETQHAEALAKFDAENGGGKPKKEEKEKKEKKEKKEDDEDDDEKKVVGWANDNVRDRNWSGLSKTELMECCVERGISKKGGKEDLTTRLIMWHSENPQTAAPKVAAGGYAPGKAPAKDDDDDEEEEADGSDESEDDDESESEEKELTKEELDESEKQYKREKIVQKAIKHLLNTSMPQGFKLDDLAEALASIKVQNFTPGMCGYKTLHEFARKQPRALFTYNKKTMFILPPRK